MKKFCPDCGSEKPLSEFAFKNKQRGERQPYCNIHRRIRERSRYQRIRKTVIGKVLKRQSQYRQEFETWKARLHCVCCSESNPVCLDFHHHKKDKEAEIATLKARYSLSYVLKEATKCVVVCRNCHAKIHNGDIVLTQRHIEQSKTLYNNAPTGGTGAESTKLGSS